MGTRLQWAGTALAGSVAVALAVGGAAIPAASAAVASVTIDAPIAPTAGTVDLTGRAGAGAGGVTSVLYVVDASDSTSNPDSLDCSGNGQVGADDNFNNDAKSGDVLDCEIAGVLALNNSLPATSGFQVGLEGFAQQAAAADVDPAGAAFVGPGVTDESGVRRIDTVARSLVRRSIGLYTPKDLGGKGSNFDQATQVALSTLGSAPAGPKWIMLLSDGLDPVADASLEQLRQSGVRLRSFGIGTRASCEPSKTLAKMASATGETCQVVANPASLAAALTESEPDAVNGVTVSIEEVSVAASLDAVGGWSARFTLGAGTYTATARAVLASGATVSTQRTFTVAASAGGPPPGSVTPGPGSLQATVVKVSKPKPTRAALPHRVTGKVGRLTGSFATTPKLKGSRVTLQARPAAGDTWKSVGRDTVDKSGAFVLNWKPKSRMTLLRVVLQPYKTFAKSAAAVPEAKISRCKVTKRASSWSLKCQTTAKTGSKVRLLKDGTVTSSARVRKNGSFHLRGSGPVSAYTVDITAGKRHIRLKL